VDFLTSLCFYPTTVIFIDDDQSFLESIPLGIQPKLAYRLFRDPVKALHFANNAKTPFINSPLYSDDQDNENQHRDARYINRQLSDVGRFDELTIVVVDYDMPHMSGLEVCQQLTDRHVKKILLTGVADEKIAVKALNRNIIDYYIQKHETDIFSDLKQTIENLQQQYFRELSDSFAYAGGQPTFLNDEKFQELFAHTREELGIVEYYFQGEAGGFLMISAGGELSRFIVYDGDDLATQIDMVDNLEGPQQLLDALVSGEQIALFPTSDGFYDESITDWKRYLYPAKRIDGKQPYYCATIEAPEIDQYLRADLVSYDTFLSGRDYTVQ
jgi:CheY-like chemotaxis protein